MLPSATLMGRFPERLRRKPNWPFRAMTGSRPCPTMPAKTRPPTNHKPNQRSYASESILGDYRRTEFTIQSKPCAITPPPTIINFNYFNYFNN